MMLTTHGRVSPSATLLALVLALAGCQEGSASGTPGGPRGGHGGRGPAEQELPVKLTELAPGDIERRYRASGTLAAVGFAELRPLQAGIVTSILVEEGDLVEAGETLARLDSRELSLLASRDRISAENAVSELKRLEAIGDRDAVAQKEIDDLRFQVETARASAKLSRHQATLSTIRAPFDGTITARHVDPGALATSATTLFEIADLRTLELELHIPEREGRVAVGAPVSLELLDGTTFEAEIHRRAPIVDPLTGTVKLTVRTTTFPASAVPGAFTRARILLESRKAVPSLPTSAVVEIDGKPHVYVIEEGKARRLPVETGLEGEERVEITGGLEAAMRVVEDAGGIADGMAIKELGDPTPAEELEASGPDPRRQKSSGGWSRQRR